MLPSVTFTVKVVVVLYGKYTAVFLEFYTPAPMSLHLCTIFMLNLIMSCPLIFLVINHQSVSLNLSPSMISDTS